MTQRCRFVSLNRKTSYSAVELLCLWSPSLPTTILFISFFSLFFIWRGHESVHVRFHLRFILTAASLRYCHTSPLCWYREKPIIKWLRQTKQMHINSNRLNLLQRRRHLHQACIQHHPQRGSFLTAGYTQHDLNRSLQDRRGKQLHPFDKFLGEVFHNMASLTCGCNNPDIKSGFGERAGYMYACTTTRNRVFITWLG